MGLLAIGGETFNVVVEGAEDRPVLMLSNSLGTTLHMWDAQMPALRDHFRVIRYDSRGHGESAAPAGPYGIDQLGRDALAILDALGVATTSWMGLSIGGMVGQWLIAHAPERLERAVLANTAARMSGTDGWNARIAAVLAHGTESITPAVIARWFTPDFARRAPDRVAPLAAMLHATPAAGYAGCCAAIRDMDLRERIRGADLPVLVVVGRDDPSTPPADGAAIAAAIKGATLVTLAAAHLSNIEDEAAFTKTVVGFLTARARRGATRKVRRASSKTKPKPKTKTNTAKPKAATRTKRVPGPVAASTAAKAKTKTKTKTKTPAQARGKTAASATAKTPTRAVKTPAKAAPAARGKQRTTLVKAPPKAAARGKPAAKRSPAKRKAAGRAPARRTRG